MTIIAGIPIQRFRILIGDILLSSPIPGDRTLSVPTQGEVNSLYPKGVTFNVSGLRQKICVISDTLVIAWAGSYLAAQIVVNDLIGRERKHPFTVESLVRFFNELDSFVKQAGVSFIAIISNPVTKDARFIAYNSAWFTSKNENFGDVFFCGSGGNDFVQLFGGVEQEVIKLVDNNKIIGVLDIATFIISVLLSQDFTNLNSLSKYYGGGYELAVWERVVGVNYFCRLATIIFAGSPLSFFGRSCCRDCVAGLLRCGSWAH